MYLSSDQTGQHFTFSKDAEEILDISSTLTCFTGNDRSPGEELKKLDQAFENSLRRLQRDLDNLGTP